MKLLSWIFATGLITFCISPFEHEATMRRWLHTQTADCRRWTIDLNRRLSGHKWIIIDCQGADSKILFLASLSLLGNLQSVERCIVQCDDTGAIVCKWSRAHIHHTTLHTTHNRKLRTNLCNIFCEPWLIWSILIYSNLLKYITKYKYKYLLY